MNPQIDQLRATVRSRRSKLPIETIATRSEQIAERAAALPELLGLSGAVVGSYWPFRGEIDPRPLTNSLNARLHLPVVGDPPSPSSPAGPSLSWRSWNDGDPLVEDRFGIATPASSGPALLAEDLDLLIVPLVVFDSEANRAGWGMGHYDRALAGLKTRTAPGAPLLVGVAYEFQRVDQLNVEPWDVPLDLVITEANVHRRWRRT